MQASLHCRSTETAFSVDWHTRVDERWAQLNTRYDEQLLPGESGDGAVASGFWLQLRIGAEPAAPDPV